ncbi:MAG: VirB3 family type IV secretion system protein [Gammaproteobacteria bacterium]|nr:VirB3 family type IV secretion system protein [Gammaproteobacteria bacterium]
MRGTSSIYFKSLNRHFTILGVDKQLFFLFVGISLPIAISARLDLLMDIIAIIIFMILYIIGVLLTRQDKQILAIFKRHIHYQKYYRATSGIHAKIPFIKPSVPFYQGKRGLV